MFLYWFFTCCLPHGWSVTFARSRLSFWVLVDYFFVWGSGLNLFFVLSRYVDLLVWVSWKEYSVFLSCDSDENCCCSVVFGGVILYFPSDFLFGCLCRESRIVRCLGIYSAVCVVLFVWARIVLPGLYVVISFGLWDPIAGWPNRERLLLRLGVLCFWCLLMVVGEFNACSGVGEVFGVFVFAPPLFQSG